MTGKRWETDIGSWLFVGLSLCFYNSETLES